MWMVSLHPSLSLSSSYSSLLTSWLSQVTNFIIHGMFPLQKTLSLALCLQLLKRMTGSNHALIRKSLPNTQVTKVFSLNFLPNSLNKENSFVVLSISNDYPYATHPRYFTQRGHNNYYLYIMISPVSVLVDIRFLLWLNVFGQMSVLNITNHCRP